MANRDQIDLMVDPEDRRKLIRYKACGGAFAILNIGEKEEIAQILDISHSGIGFRYLSSGSSPGKKSELDITIQNDGLLVAKIPYQSVYDADYLSSFNTSSSRIRRHGAYFIALPAEMAQHLDYFIQYYTFGYA